MQQIEFWKTIPSFPSYQASSLGKVRSLLGKEPKVLKQVVSGGNTQSYRKHGTGYFMVNLYQDKSGHMKYVHRLVAEAFYGDIKGKIVDHIDGNKLNNRVDNLQLMNSNKDNSRKYWNVDLKAYANSQRYLIDTDDEVWKQVNGLSYEVSTYGNVRKLSTKKLLVGQDTGNHNYLRFTVSGEKICIPRAQLVADAFLSNPYKRSIVVKRDPNGGYSYKNLFLCPMLTSKVSWR